MRNSFMEDLMRNEIKASTSDYPKEFASGPVTYGDASDFN